MTAQSTTQTAAILLLDGGTSYGGDCQYVPAWERRDRVETARTATRFGGLSEAGCAAIAGVLAIQRVLFTTR